LIAQGVTETQRFEVDSLTLQQWSSGAPLDPAPGSGFNRDLVSAYLKARAAQIDHPAREGVLDFDPQTVRLTVVMPARTGQELEQLASIDAIQAAIAGGYPEANLAVRIVSPRVDTSNLDALGIRELVSEGSTVFAGSSPERVMNIATAASRMHNAVIAPDEEFSFNKTLGDISTAAGYVYALVISGDRTELGVGGGVCQVSTTVFRAAYAAGLPIVERWAHSYIVHWYGEPGLDATIYSPSVDLRFKNDTGRYLLLQSKIDNQAGKLIMYLYGTKPARQVITVGPYVTNVRPAPEPLYVEDKSLPQGAVRQVDWAVTGEDVVVVRRVRNGDGTLREDKFVSHYQPWRAIYLYGPGTALAAKALP
jgi:vancomycin resistance protein YoaR